MAPFRPTQKTTRQEYITFLLQLVVRMRRVKWTFNQLPNPSQFDWVKLDEEMYLIKIYHGNFFLISSFYELVDLGKEKYKYAGKKGSILWDEWISKIPDVDIQTLYRSTLHSFEKDSPTIQYLEQLINHIYQPYELPFQDDFQKYLSYEEKKV